MRIDHSNRQRRQSAARDGARTAWKSGVCAAIALTFAASAHAGAPAKAVPSPERIREVLRSHELHTLDGKSFSIASLGDEVVVVNFWASWCKPCRKELPALDDLHTRLAKQGGHVVAISIDEDPANVRRFVREHHLGLPVCLDGPGGLARELDLGQVPFTVILDRAGQVAFSGSGSDAKALAQIDAVTQRLLTADRALSEGAVR